MVAGAGPVWQLTADGQAAVRRRAGGGGRSARREAGKAPPRRTCVYLDASPVYCIMVWWGRHACPCVRSRERERRGRARHLPLFWRNRAMLGVSTSLVVARRARVQPESSGVPVRAPPRRRTAGSFLKNFTTYFSLAQTTKNMNKKRSLFRTLALAFRREFHTRENILTEIQLRQPF